MFYTDVRPSYRGFLTVLCVGWINKVGFFCWIYELNVVFLLRFCLFFLFPFFLPVEFLFGIAFKYGLNREGTRTRFLELV